MAARYADAANIVAQGQSFYTGLLPGSYENTGGALKGNVYGKGSGGSANVTADRTGSEAAALSIGDYKAKAGPTPASILKAGEVPSDTDRIVAAIGRGPINRGPDDGGAAPLPNPGGRGGGQASGQGLGDLIPGGWPQHQGQNPFGQNPMGTGQKPQHGSVQGLASTRSHTRQPGVQQSIPQQAIPSLSVSGAASTRSHTRQSGVQQSATQQSIPFPNMPNSTNRSLKF